MSETTRFVPLEPLSLEGLDTDQAVLRLLSYAASLKASDLFLNTEEAGGSIFIRHLGILKPVAVVTRGEIIRYINFVKAMAGMALEQKMRPSDGRWVCTLENGVKIDLRVNTIPTVWGEDMAIRLLECEAGLLQLTNLGFHKRVVDDLLVLLSSPAGLFLVTGPAGAGKTTTLYACLHYLNDGTRKINTIEDPVELILPGIRQSEIRPKIDLDFPELLRSVLRQAPDVIMIGEIRDPVTAETAVHAANSGHLVFATLHAPVAAGAINSMLALGVNPHFLAASMLGALSQRLVRRLCDQCKVAYELTGATHTFEEVRRWLEPGQGEHIYSAKGCPACHFEGFIGRTGVGEIIRVTREIRTLIFERRPLREIRQQALRLGMLDLRRAALLKVAQGETSMEEVLRTIPAEHLLPEESD
jgi:type II secretory ATPase GspE/PulE/Tfp pilus assembly ATPase PilB-like protein